MHPQTYNDALKVILDAHSSEVAARLVRFRAAAEDAGTAIDGIILDVFVDQDGEGPFDVWARFSGPSAFKLDRQFDDDRNLFGVEWTEDGWEPNVPARPRGWTRDDLESALFEAVSEWLSPLIPLGDPEDFWRIGTPWSE
ncbi:DUF6389 family protein [Leucobacter sp. UT-8R-CII-1-4]|uniref:DUF6389 family protein n=1 Tax=Leucobacter sp. UT-8R-CII-1-4 TaxID=3040075 RepID=UPI0024A8F097|nr:DUF6389 family protein [Leucobacter sp. UT-8R-CII-1-4]MDI6022402.1 DUF6389 family protein [Leucobacter sp. UT-8R-CII-1-4]